ncbi:MAG: sporulation membrane protein YtaF [Negativicutes bacterium]|nr:sporulation membrane protein YtaF [Negativicutes bacterium]
MNLLYVLLLGFAVSLDSFAAGIAYGLKNIRIPFHSLTVVGLVTAFCTSAAMFGASVLDRVIDMQIAAVAGSLLLIGLGGFSLFQEYLSKNAVIYRPNGDVSIRQLTFSMGRLVINIMVRPEAADIDRSNSISSLEAVFLGLALGIDNMVATFAASLMGMLPIYTPVIMGLIQMALISAGSQSSCRMLSDSWKKRFPFLPGTILILIGLLRLG